MTSEAATETTAAPAGNARRRRGYFLPGFIALAALVAIGAALGAGDLSHGAPRSLSGPDVASQIALGIQSAEARSTAPGVTCPASEPVRSGVSFTCRMQAPGTPQQSVQVTEIDSRGHLRWTLVPTPGGAGGG